MQIKNRVLYRFEIQKALGLQSLLMFSGGRIESAIFFRPDVVLVGMHYLDA